ncbi:MAG: biotin transporter BioY [Butyrivibrio sp.]|uniref:biotin transporter BioY n=1 Tax=Butyrivibrio sp. TaxID=28121 RepID=UPI001B09A652|nr:biotin transporter BioY [Butyrivibrio sp.]MBO6242782.1 biotin transporter BioY [Butyrivibrio sp.]
MSSANAVKTRDNSKVLDLVYIAIGAALIAICSWISIPTAVPFTLQTFAVFFVLLALGGERGTLATLVYVLLGAVGVPVFAGFSGGIGVLLGNTGGYIIGFLLTGLIYILFTKFFKKNIVMKVIALVLGLAVCYAFGTAWFMHVYMKSSGEVGLLTVLGWCVFPFIIPDLLKLALAVVISKRIEPVIK